MIDKDMKTSLGATSSWKEFSFWNVLLFLLIGQPATGFAQGTIKFANLAAGVNAPVFMTDGITKLSGPEFSAVLLAGPTVDNLSVLAKTPFLKDTAAGYFSGGMQTIPTMPGGSVAFVQVQFWPSKYLVPINNCCPVFDPWLWGWSPEFAIVLGNAPTLPTTGPAILSELGNAPIRLEAPRLQISLTHTNTLLISRHVPSSHYALFSDYLLQQNESLNEADWTTVTNTLNTFVNHGPDLILPRPSGPRFYRLVSQ
jgi:hypothetical protein